MDESHSTLEATIHGLVQGVGFRVFVRSIALRLGIRGYVRNMPDGSLRVVASGPRVMLQSLLGELERGPAGADVSSVDATWQSGEAEGLNTPFEVKF